MAVMYGGYYDESMDDVSFAVAGYIAPYDTWIHLDWAWRDLLKAWNVKYFKASECENGLGEFAQYRDNPTDAKSRLKTHEWEKLQEAKNQFIDAIVKHSDFIQGTGAVTNLKDFNRIISEESEARRLFMDHPYYVCFQAALAAGTKKMYEENLRRAGEGKLYIKPIFDSHTVGQLECCAAPRRCGNRHSGPVRSCWKKLTLNGVAAILTSRAGKSPYP